MAEYVCCASLCPCGPLSLNTPDLKPWPVTEGEATFPPPPPLALGDERTNDTTDSEGQCALG